MEVPDIDSARPVAGIRNRGAATEKKINESFPRINANINKCEGLCHPTQYRDVGTGRECELHAPGNYRSCLDSKCMRRFDSLICHSRSGDRRMRKALAAWLIIGGIGLGEVAQANTIVAESFTAHHLRWSPER
jgi:hypothetical protein